MTRQFHARVHLVPKRLHVRRPPRPYTLSFTCFHLAPASDGQYTPIVRIDPTNAMRALVVSR